MPAMEAVRFKGTVLDIHSRSAFAGGHLSGSLFLRYDILSSHLGYLVKKDTLPDFFADDLSREPLSLAYMTLLHMGYSAEYVKEKDDILLLDVRKDNERSYDDPMGERLCIVLSRFPTSLEEISEGEEDPAHLPERRESECSGFLS